MVDVGSWMLVVSLLAQDRPGLFFREDWKETPPETPVTQAHVANPELVLSLHGPGKAGIRKSHHDKPADDPYYVWTGECPATCALSLRHKSASVDLTGLDPQARRWNLAHRQSIRRGVGRLAGAGIQRIRYPLAASGYCEGG